MGDLTRCRSSVALGSAAAGVLGEAAAGLSGTTPGTIISGTPIDREYMGTPADGFFSRIFRSPREYSNSSRLCSLIKQRSCSICWTSGLAMEELSTAFEGCFRFMPVSELDEIPRYAGQYFGIPCVHGDVIFNAYSPDAGHVNPRFNRDHESRFQPCLLPARDAGILVYFQAQSMPRAMCEKPVQFVAGQNLPRSSIHISAGNSGSYRRYR